MQILTGSLLPLDPGVVPIPDRRTFLGIFAAVLGVLDRTPPAPPAGATALAAMPDPGDFDDDEGYREGPDPARLTFFQRAVLQLAGDLGEKETLSRLMLSGRYQAIYDAMMADRR